MTHAGIINVPRPEPCFDPPPRFVGIHDRRLGERIAAEWAEHVPRRAAGAGSTKLPAAHAFGDTVAPNEGNCVWLKRRGGSVELTAIGALVARVFAVRPGTLDASPFAHALGTAFAQSIDSGEPALFEGGFARHPGTPATLLTRGVVVPLADEAGAGRACAVVSWTETLAPAESGRLRRELLAALRETPVHVEKRPYFAIW